VIIASREDIAEQLWLRDEPDLARTMLDVDDATHRRVMEVAAKPTTGYFIHNEIDELLVAAAVKVLTGTRRRPRRWRAGSPDLLPQFWQEVGPERDHRGHRDPIADVMRLLDED
jgi:Arc/MetJ family transcription regulator